MTTNNHYEHKLVNIGEEADNLIDSLRERNKVLQSIVNSKKDVPEDFEHEKKVYQFRLDTIEKHNKELRDHLTKGFELSLKDQDTIEELKKEIKLLKKDNSRNFHRSRLAYLEKLVTEYRYVFSDIPNNEENLKMVKLMKKHINPDRYNLRWRGQYLIDGEDWRKYTDGQPMNKSKCIRVYIDSKGSDTTEGFKESEVHAIREGLDLLVDSCEENIRSWSSTDLDTDADEDLINEKKTLETTQQLLSYFTSMVIHLEESKLARAEVTNNVT